MQTSVFPFTSWKQKKHFSPTPLISNFTTRELQIHLLLSSVSHLLLLLQHWNDWWVFSELTYTKVSTWSSETLTAAILMMVLSNSANWFSFSSHGWKKKVHPFQLAWIDRKEKSTYSAEADISLGLFLRLLANESDHLLNLLRHIDTVHLSRQRWYLRERSCEKRRSWWRGWLRVKEKSRTLFEWVFGVLICFNLVRVYDPNRTTTMPNFLAIIWIGKMLDLTVWLFLTAQI